MKRFAFYGRCSTEDMQDPASSRDWQLDRARALIEPTGGVIVVEFFDKGQSRALPWSRRPEAIDLLAAVAAVDCPFDAIVVGELARAFGDGMDREGVTRVLEFYEVELWHPDAQGRHDRHNVSHRITASLKAELAQEEREQMKGRVRDAMKGQTKHEGRFLGGRPPYGYTLVDLKPHPNPAKATAGQMLHRLARDSVTAPVVLRIFHEYVAGAGLHAIAEGLTRDGIPSPSANDPARNRHRNTGGAWAKSAVRAVLRNPRYTGYQVWGKQPKFERLLDVTDPASGFVTRQRWSDPSTWVWSSEPSHDALIDRDLFDRAQEIARSSASRPLEGKRRRTERRYLFSGLTTCGLCHRKMSGSWNNERANYRCRFPAEYAIAKNIDHPKTVYVREDAIESKLDKWLSTAFSDENIRATCDEFAVASESDDTTELRAEAARRKLEDCDARLGRYRATLDAGGDPRTVAGWMSEVQGERLGALSELAAATPVAPLSAEDVMTLAGDMRTVVETLTRAGRSQKADLYLELGIRLEYLPAEDVVVVEVPLVAACTTERVEGGT